MAYTIPAVRVGRLLEFRLGERGFESVGHVEEVLTAFAAALRARPTTGRLVTVVDLRGAPVMPAELSQRLLDALIKYNVRTERAAVLVAHTSPVAVLQHTRVLREVGHAGRRLFFHADELLEWLEEVLSKEELARARQFLAEL